MDRLVIVPDETLEPLTLQLRARLSAIAARVRGENIADLLDDGSRRVLTRAVRDRDGAELLVWARSHRGFLVGWTTLSPEAEVAGVATASADDGIISRVFASGLSETQQAELQPDTWTNLQQRRGRTLERMAATPLLLFEVPVAVLTLGRYRDAVIAQAPAEDATTVAESAAVVTRLMEDHLIRALLGLETP